MTTTPLFDQVVEEGLVVPCFGLRAGIHRIVAFADVSAVPPLPLGRELRDLGTFRVVPDEEGYLDVLHETTFLPELTDAPLLAGRVRLGHTGRARVRVFTTGAAGMAGFLANIVIQPHESPTTASPVVVGDPFVDYAEVQGFAEPLVSLDD